MNIREYAGYSRGGGDWTGAFALAMARLKEQGGGTLQVPPGAYPTGAIRMESHVTLEVQAGATLLFHPREDAYPLVSLAFRGEGRLSHQACVFAQNAEHVTLTGEGALDGQGAYWWKRHAERRLAHPRPSLVCFADCSHVTVENVTLRNSPAWTVHPLRCRDVLVRGLSIRNPADSPNTDGVNPDACQDVRILNCEIDVGDDCVALKAGTENTPGLRACQDILIADCRFLHGHGGIVLGSETSGGIRNVTVENCVFRDTDRGVRLKTRRGRGGAVEGVRLSRLDMERVMCPFVFNMRYHCGEDGKARRVWDAAPYPVDGGTPALRDVFISDVEARDCSACAGFFCGLAEMPITRVTLRDVSIAMRLDGQAARPAMMQGCPDMRGAGFFLRDARQIDLSGARLTGVQGALIDMDESVSLA